MMSETSARAKRLARRLGSLARNGLIGRRAWDGDDGVGDWGAVALVGVDVESTGGGGGNAGTVDRGGAVPSRLSDGGVGWGAYECDPPDHGIAEVRENSPVRYSPRASSPTGVAYVGTLPTPGAGTWMIPLHTEQRARTPPAGTFAGSTRKTEEHSGHVTFTCSLSGAQS